MQECDIEQLYKVLSDDEVMKYIEKPFSNEQTKEFVFNAGMREEPLVYSVVYKESGKVIGHVIFHRYDSQSYELGWILHRVFWYQGIASEITEAMIMYAKQIGISRLVMECAAEQRSTKRVAEKFRFNYVGKDGDCEVYMLELESLLHFKD